METRIRLYKRQSKKGTSYIGGLVKLTELTKFIDSDTLSLALFPNTFKKGEKDADFTLLVSPYKKAEIPKSQSDQTDIPF